MQTYLRLLRENPAYTRLWIAQCISLLGDWFSTIALTALVAQYSNSSGMALTLLLVSRFLPPLIIGPFAGVIVDRMNRKRLLIISDISRFVIVILFLTVNDAAHLWLIYALTLIQFTFGSIFEPARSAITPSLVSPNDLVRANILGSVTWSVMLAAGAAIGGGVAAIFGTQTALIIDALSFALSAMFIMSIRLPTQPSAPTQAHPAKSQTGFRDGLRYIQQHPTTALALLIKLFGNIGNLDTFMAIYATKVFVVGEQGTGSLGIFYSVFGFGAILGPLILNRFNNGSVTTMRRLVAIGYVWITLGMFLFGVAPSLLIASAAVFLRAMGGSTYWTYSSVILQKTVPDHFLGRLFSIDFAGAQLAAIITFIVIGWLVDNTDPARISSLVIGTAVVTLIPLVLWILGITWAEKQEQITAVPEQA
ncbi:MAG: MFS transporter [Anaerolineae bacterium]|nr:MFS transporter [Anaerolineae bacterium]